MAIYSNILRIHGILDTNLPADLIADIQNDLRQIPRVDSALLKAFLDALANVVDLMVEPCCSWIVGWSCREGHFHGLDLVLDVVVDARGTPELVGDAGNAF